MQIFLVAGASVWVHTGFQIAREHILFHESWVRAVIIIGAVAIVALVSAAALRSKQLVRRYEGSASTAVASVAAFLLVFVFCSFPQVKMHHPIPLFAERVFAGGGWIEILCLSVYAAWLAERLVSAPATGLLRRRIWIFFSLVFFTQVLLGLAGLPICLMTGKLHLPVPALVFAGPLYRGEGFFMPILFGATILFAGPVWCSWLCYIGSWDNLAAESEKLPGRPIRHRDSIRAGILVCTIAAGLILRWCGVPAGAAAAAGGAFGIGGIAIMVFLSSKRGSMLHCTMYCPIGLIADIAGKINPFRIKIGTGCTDCRHCARVCRYGALTAEDIRRRRPGLTCTLCGDCTSACGGRQIDYHFPGLNASAARTAFIVIVVFLHALFLGFGRL